MITETALNTPLVAAPPAAASLAPARPAFLGMRRGAGLRCPNCGQGALFRKYLKVQPCPACGNDNTRYPADDAPPYFTILVVGHVIGAMMLIVEEHDDTLPIWLHVAVWPVLTVVMCLLLLPRIKGALIGLQWALRMHGFGGEKDAVPATQPAT